uniref:Uncharacterized protein n=1 Tax=Fusarium oxysporum (strain Fo5176) TaxID=660025 RepID=A0A0D2Y1U3_FUSOF
MSRRSSDAPRRNLSYAQRPVAGIYYHSRAATQKKYRRRATTILEYCDENPHLLPQLPFTWHHGWKRWKLFIFALLVFVDALVIPITLYYGMRYAGEVEGWIIFAIVATIWGGPTYLEFAILTWAGQHHFELAQRPEEKRILWPSMPVVAAHTQKLWLPVTKLALASDE